MTTRRNGNSGNIIILILAYHCRTAALPLLFLACLPARPQDNCGQVPGEVRYSESFYKAQAKYASAASGSSDSVDIPLTGSFQRNSNSQTINHEELTLQQAYDYVQQEHKSHHAEIIRECGYRLCKLANVTSPNAMQAIGVMSALCTSNPFPGKHSATGCRFFHSAPFAGHCVLTKHSAQN